MSISDTVKRHPFIIAAAIFIIGGAVIYSMAGGEVATVGVPTGNVEGASDIQAQNASLQALGMQLTGQQALQDSAIAGQVKLAQISSDLQYNANNLAAGIASQQIQERATESTLAAQTAQHQIDAQVQGFAIQAQTLKDQTDALTNVLITQITEQNKTIRDTSCHGFGCLF